MTLTPEEKVLAGQFAETYRLAQSEPVQAVERAVCGCDYGGTSWTTKSEADEMARLMALQPGTRLLDLGAGSGWPALYLAQTTGADVVLVDVPPEALGIAAERAKRDGVAGSCRFAAADGAALPFRDASFDAVSHSDVLCCLEAKLPVLEACRRAIADDGIMVFSVISIAPGLASSDYRRAADSGPPYIEAPLAYPEMLRRAGWHVVEQFDLTPDYAAAGRRLLQAEDEQADGLRELYGAAEIAERRLRRRRSVKVKEEGLQRRELFVTRPA